MKLDLKSSLLIVFFIGFALFFAKWWLEGDSYRKENKRLKDEITQIGLIRDSLEKDRREIDNRIKNLYQELQETKSRIATLDAQLAINNKELKSAKDKLNNLQSGLNETKRKIQELKSKPIKRTGSSLLNSIKDKIKK